MAKSEHMLISAYSSRPIRMRGTDKPYYGNKKKVVTKGNGAKEKRTERGEQQLETKEF